MGICLHVLDTLETTKTAHAKQRTNGTLNNGAEPLQDFPDQTRLRFQ